MLKKVIVYFLLVLFSLPSAFSQEKKQINNLVIENIPEIPENIINRMQQYQHVRSADITDWMPNGKGILMTTRFGETNQLHLIEFPGGMRRQITFFDEPVYSGYFCPDTNYNGFIFSKDEGGNEYSQLFWFDLNTSEYSMITDGESVNRAPSWSNKGDQFCYSSTKRNGKDYDIYLASVENPKEAEMILQNNGYWIALDWSPDDSQLLILNYISRNLSNLYILDLNTGELTLIPGEGENDVSFGGGIWSNDGNGVFLVNDENSEFHTLKHYDIREGTYTPISHELRWDIDNASVNTGRDKMVFSINENGFNRLFLLDMLSLEYHEITAEIPRGEINSISFHPYKDQIAISVNTPQTPGDIYVLETKNNHLSRWTHSEVGGLNTDQFIIPELIKYKTFDEVDGKAREIPAFYYKPKKHTGQIPVLIYIHGGPESQYIPDFSSVIAYFTNEMGIAVLAPNVRGSAGYGKSYLKLDNGYLRENSVKDIGSLLDWIKNNPDLDEERVAVYGGSYGGYMVLASMFMYNERLKCGIDVVGISNFVTFLQNTKEYRRDLRRVEYGDERDEEMKEFLHSISPTTNASKITKPLFVIQGANDPRVPQSEAEQIVETVRQNGTEVWYLLALDEGHGFRKKNNRDYMRNAIVMFLEKYLLE